jgi:iron complex outermembrane recepter protein
MAAIRPDYLLFLAALLIAGAGLSQTRVSGVVRDATSGETLPGATVLYAEGKGTTTDLDGQYTLMLERGTYTLTVNYVGMNPVSKEIKVGASPMTVDFQMESVTMKEVVIVADIAVERRTPVAYTDVSPIRIREELGTRDIPMLLNSTPGIYATQSGGGDGDARINIRGFNQRYVAVMVDGVPMNDMENGWVYWSNWFGLDVVTQKIQVQRGLGASKLAVPSIGGTINILSQGIEQKAQLTFSSEVGNNQNLRQTIGYNSGRLSGGWGVTAALSYRSNQGWVENLQSKQLFYFIKVQKDFDRSSLSLSVMGSPQEHFQRPNRLPVKVYNSRLASELGIPQGIPAGVDPTLYSGGNNGIRHNPYWGTLERNRGGAQSEEELLTSRLNYYHKPIVNLKHFWTINESLALSNIVYASFGNGGGTALKTESFDQNGQTDFDGIYYNNTHGNIFVPPYDLTVVDDTSQYKSKNYILSRINNHFWGGLISQLRYKPNRRLEISAGLDGRYYHTDRYQEMYDLLGGDYAVPSLQGDDANNPGRIAVREGDRFGYNIRTYVNQGGAFFLTEYKMDNWSAFVNVTGSVNAYNRTNYFALKNEDGSYQTSGWKTYPAGTVKGGFNYNIHSHHSVFVNAGYLSRAQMASNVFVGTSLDTYRTLENELIIAQELGYLFSKDAFRAAVNLYNTRWNNRPVRQTFAYGTETYPVSIPGMNALHQGGEIEAEWRASDKLSVDAVFSAGNWRWTSDGEAIVTDEAGVVVIDTVRFNANGVKVGDAAQFQTSLSFRYEPVKGLYLRPRITYFDWNYSDFDPESLQGDNANRQSWMIPSYYQVDVSMGYNTFIGEKRYKLGFRAQLMNLTDEAFISDARNNEYGNGFNAASAGVYMGMGFRWNFGVNFTF